MITLDKAPVQGNAWNRCRNVILDNPLEGEKSCLFFRENVVTTELGTVKMDSGTMKIGYNPSSTIPLRDPQTGELTGETVTQEYLYKIMYSLFVQGINNLGI